MPFLGGLAALLLAAQHRTSWRSSAADGLPRATQPARVVPDVDLLPATARDRRAHLA